jgi:hypothetical protein
LASTNGGYPSLKTANLTEITTKASFAPGDVWMPFVDVISSGKVYFPYLQANDDSYGHFAHARGTDGFNYLFVEDLPSGGDQDFDDIIIRLSQAA